MAWRKEAKKRGGEEEKVWRHWLKCLLGIRSRQLKSPYEMKPGFWNCQILPPLIHYCKSLKNSLTEEVLQGVAEMLGKAKGFSHKIMVYNHTHDKEVHHVSDWQVLLSAQARWLQPPQQPALKPGKRPINISARNKTIYKLVPQLSLTLTPFTSIVVHSVRCKSSWLLCWNPGVKIQGTVSLLFR